MQTSLTARSALRAQQQQLDTIANNIANINTAGFKSSSVNFKDTLYTEMVRPTDTQNTRLQNGTGVRVGSVVRSFANGTPVSTGNGLDFCLTGDGFFTIQAPNGETLYTRNGSFHVSGGSGAQYLVTADGGYVMGTSGRIQIPNGDLSTLGLNEKGELTISAAASSTTSQTATAASSPSAFATLKISSFQNNDGLEAVGGTSFRATVASGNAQTVASPQVLQGYQESSNVDLTTEMTTLIRAQKAFSFASQVVKTADEMDAMANNMRT